MLSPFDDFYFGASPAGYPYRRHGRHQRGGGGAGGSWWPVMTVQPRTVTPTAASLLSPTANYGGLLSNVLNEGFRELQQMERELGHVLTNVGGDGQLTNEGGGYKFSCSVAGYAPDELSVDLEGDELVISGEHKAEGEGQSIHRQFTRRVLLPDTMNKETISCNIDDRGQLEVRAAAKKELPPPAEKVNIPIGFKESASSGAPAVGEGQQGQGQGQGKMAMKEKAAAVDGEMRDGQKA